MPKSLWLLVVVLFYLLIFQSKKTSASRGWQDKDELYIDDDDAEGSGNRDLEASGSGFGPDDEDGDDSGNIINLL